jgi:hypothetical protein
MGDCIGLDRVSPLIWINPPRNLRRLRPYVPLSYSPGRLTLTLPMSLSGPAPSNTYPCFGPTGSVVGPYPRPCNRYRYRADGHGGRRGGG